MEHLIHRTVVLVASEAQTLGRAALRLRALPSVNLLASRSGPAVKPKKRRPGNQQEKRQSVLDDSPARHRASSPHEISSLRGPMAPPPRVIPGVFAPSPAL